MSLFRSNIFTAIIFVIIPWEFKTFRFCHGNPKKSRQAVHCYSTNVSGRAKICLNPKHISTSMTASSYHKLQAERFSNWNGMNPLAVGERIVILNNVWFSSIFIACYNNYFQMNHIVTKNVFHLERCRLKISWRNNCYLNIYYFKYSFAVCSINIAEYMTVECAYHYISKSAQIMIRCHYLSHCCQSPIISRRGHRLLIILALGKNMIA